MLPKNCQNGGISGIDSLNQNVTQIGTESENVIQTQAIDDAPEKLHTCEICDYETKRKKDLKRHTLIHMNNEEKKIFMPSLRFFNK